MKPAHKSKTVIFNVLTGAASVLSMASGVIPPTALPWVMLAQSVVNIGLRFVTSQRLGPA